MTNEEKTQKILEIARAASKEIGRRIGPLLDDLGRAGMTDVQAATILQASTMVVARLARSFVVEYHNAPTAALAGDEIADLIEAGGMPRRDSDMN